MHVVMEVAGGSDSGMEPTPDSSLTSERDLCGGDGTSEGGSESSAASGGRRGLSASRPPRNPLSRSVSVRASGGGGGGNLRSPQDDGRWPSNTRRNLMSVSISGITPERKTGSESGTVVRRRRKSAENLSKSREPSLNRTASLRRKKAEEGKSSSAGNGSSAGGGSGGGTKKVRPSSSRTRIYHETACQTGLTGRDIEEATAARLPDPASRVEMANVAVQAEGRIEDFDKLEKEKRDLEERAKRLTEEKSGLTQELTKEKEERRIQDERIRNILGLGEKDDITEFIEKDRKKTNEIVRKQQLEINQLHTLCCNLKKEIERCILTEKRLIEEQRETEAESLEIQEFLQAEKSTMADTLKELEVELLQTKQSLSNTEAELAKQQEECSHIVRMCEQRRQEKLSLESRIRTLELRNKESMLVQGAAVSGAAVALSGLGSRLEVLVSSLVTAYNISAADLEDVVYHNEVYSESDSSGDLSPEVEEKKGGLLAAIMSAIRSATHRSTPGVTDTFSESELLASETEPNLCDKRPSFASLPDISPIKSQRASIAASDDFDLSTTEGGLTNSESLQNLSDAILKRQKEEEESMMYDQHPQTQGGGIIDQVIEVDNMVTRLLRVLHIIEASRHGNRVNGEREISNNINETIEILKAEVKDLKNKLHQSEKSVLQVESLQKELKEKEKELIETEKKYELAKELLTDNYHKAMSEVRRLYDAVDNALELIQDAEHELGRHEVFVKVKRGLEETNFRCASTLPISTSRPDLNANAAVPLNVA